MNAFYVLGSLLLLIILIPYCFYTALWFYGVFVYPFWKMIYDSLCPRVTEAVEG